MPAIIRNFGKLNAIVLFGAAMTLGLFYSMQLLVMTEQGVPQVKSRTIFPDITLPEIQLEIRHHLFFPATVEVPANQKVRLLIINNDATPEEFESYELNREKVIPGNSRTVIFIGPLAPGEYPFFGEFFPKTAQGKVVAK